MDQNLFFIACGFAAGIVVFSLVTAINKLKKWRRVLSVLGVTLLVGGVLYALFSANKGTYQVCSFDYFFIHLPMCEILGLLMGTLTVAVGAVLLGIGLGAFIYGAALYGAWCLIMYFAAVSPVIAAALVLSAAILFYFGMRGYVEECQEKAGC